MQQATPLAERMRPKTLDGFLGQEELIGKKSFLRRALEEGHIPSMILWGPPGVGKTTLAKIIANLLKRPFYTLSAISSGVKDVREAIEKAKKQQFFNTASPILFIDEIHRFSKSQQDSLLGAVEQGIITLIGATTENPSFEVISALLSRCQVFVLNPLSKENLEELLNRALKEDTGLKSRNITIKETDALFRISGGDARKLLNALELVVNATQTKKVTVTDKKVLHVVQQNLSRYDKGGDQHYDIASAFIKSMRGSDPNAAVYWLARMIEGGEDPKFIARRMLILASEDIGMANPTAMVMAQNCFQAVQVIGYPECELILSQAVIYLATSPKSNSAYKAIKEARQKVKETGSLPVPLHIRNAPTSLMSKLDYGKGYKYSHNYKGNFEDQEYLPDELSGNIFYDPADNKRESELRKALKAQWKERYGY